MLFLAYFREKEYAYKLIAQYKIGWKGAFSILLVEPMLILIGSFIFCILVLPLLERALL